MRSPPVFVERVGHRAAVEPEPFTQQRGRLGDELHVAVLDAVVHHLHEVAGRAEAAVGDTEPRRRARCDGLEDWPQALPRVDVTAGHERRALEGALRAAGHAHADEAPGPPLRLRRAAVAVGVQAVARVDDDVAVFEERVELVDDVVDGLAGVDEHHEAARALEAGDELLQRRHHVELRIGVCRGEGLRVLEVQRVSADGEATGSEVAGEVSAHHAEANHGHVIECRHRADSGANAVNDASMAQPQQAVPEKCAQPSPRGRVGRRAWCADEGVRRAPATEVSAEPRHEERSAFEGLVGHQREVSEA